MYGTVVSAPVVVVVVVVDEVVVVNVVVHVQFGASPSKPSSSALQKKVFASPEQCAGQRTLQLPQGGYTPWQAEVSTSGPRTGG